MIVFIGVVAFFFVMSAAGLFGGLAVGIASSKFKYHNRLDAFLCLVACVILIMLGVLMFGAL